MSNLMIAFCVAALLAVMAGPAKAYEMNAPRVNVSYKSLCNAIQAARAKLADSPLPVDFRIGDQATGRDAILAIWSPDRSLTEIRTIEVKDGISRTPGYAVEVHPSNGLWLPGQDPYNGVNTTYDVVYPAGWYPLTIKVNTRRFGEAIYQPYQVAYQTHENISNGLQYLMDAIRTARTELDELHVMSRWQPGKLLTEAIDADMVASLILDEHMDKDEAEARGIKWSVDKALVLLALNRERTYRYAVSSAAAAGIAQFIKGTYDDTRRDYPEASLPEGFLEGMRDHARAVMTMHCHVDDIFSRLSNVRVRQPATPQLRGAVMAAAYNAGFGDPTCRKNCKRGALPAYKRHLSLCKKSKDRREWCHKDHGLPDETIAYVRKFAGVYEYVTDLRAFPSPFPAKKAAAKGRSGTRPVRTLIRVGS